MEKQLSDLAPLADFVQQLRSGKGVPDSQKSDVEKLEERIAAAEKTANDEREARFRLQVANTKGLTPEQAARLQGKTLEELTNDADALLAAFPKQAATTDPPPSTTPRPDPSQGQRGPVDIDALIAEAEKTGNVRESIRLKQAKALQNRTQ
ncbi:hypothetical protein AOZ06_07785 [Kibdelosporangium phytohabitans]|uniref:Scaffolding protein n=1 Tax=Kibdelosporangium phytohabitans TaxID=860235 RepID=A0A0N9HQ74_9PSEU|nr:hypothetical protein AOZ06_07785 [Kibdelosporangium phytohabitans]